MYQPYPSSGRPAGALRPAIPAAVLSAVKLMCVGAAVFAVSLIISIISVPFIGRSAAMLRLAGRQPLPVVIMVGSAGGLVVIALWLWMARANSQGRNWDEDSLAAAERQFVRHGAECDTGVVGSDVASSV